MSLVHDLMSFFSYSDNYNRYAPAIKPTMLPEQAGKMLRAFGKYYEQNPGGFIALADFHAWCMVNIPKSGIVPDEEFITAVISESNSVDETVLQVLIDRVYATELADISMAIAEGEGTKTWSDVVDSVERYKNASVKLSKGVSREVLADSQSMLETLQAASTRHGLEWSLPSLCRLLGKLSTELVIVAARPDGGKTTFLAHNAWYFAKQLPEGKCVLWCNNEEAIDKVKRRVWSSALECTDTDLLSDPLGSELKYNKLGIKDKIVFIDDCDHIDIVSKAIDKYNPGIIIIDLLYKVQGNLTNKDVTEAERFWALCNWARDLAKHKAPVIITNQLDSTAEGQMFPPQNALYGSKTGAQQEADAILTIGRIPTDQTHRYFHTPKNKITSSDEQLALVFDRFKARFYEA